MVSRPERTALLVPFSVNKPLCRGPPPAHLSGVHSSSWDTDSGGSWGQLVLTLWQWESEEASGLRAPLSCSRGSLLGWEIRCYLSACLIPISGPSALISLPQQTHCSLWGLQVGRKRPGSLRWGWLPSFLLTPLSWGFRPFSISLSTWHTEAAQ